MKTDMDKAKMDMDKAFPPADNKNAHVHHNRTYDVRITLNKSGDNRPFVIRFGFINSAARIFGTHPFIEASDIEYTKDKVYFRTHEEKAHKNIHTLSSNGKTRQDSCYFAMTPPTERVEKIYRANWIGKTFNLSFDDINQLYYIENAKKEDK